MYEANFLALKATKTLKEIVAREGHVDKKQPKIYQYYAHETVLG